MNKLSKQINKQSGTSLSTKVKYCTCDFIEKYQGMRTILISIAVAINIYLVYITVQMYELTENVDTQWVVFVGYWAAYLSIVIAFYFKERSCEAIEHIKHGTELGSDAIKKKEKEEKTENKLPTTRNVTVYTSEDNPDFFNDGEF